MKTKERGEGEMRATRLTRFSGHNFLTEFIVSEVIEFDAELNGVSCRIRNTSGGFGLPHIIVMINSPHGIIELGLIEWQDDGDYIQDGNDPLQVSGWAWRKVNADNSDLMSGGWCDKFYDTAQEALNAANPAVSGAGLRKEREMKYYFVNDERWGNEAGVVTETQVAELLDDWWRDEADETIDRKTWETDLRASLHEITEKEYKEKRRKNETS